MRSIWTDSRLDDFKNRVDERFNGVENRLSELSGRIDENNARIDSLQHAMLQAFIGLMVVMATGFMGIAGLIITQI